MNEEQNIPLYAVIKNAILENIKNQVWPSGTKLPSESELCNIYKASRITVRQALMELQNEGVVTKHHGKGTFVEKSKMTIGLFKLMGYTEQLKLKGIDVSQKILECKLVPASMMLSEKLKVALNDPVISIYRLRYANDEPYILSKTWLPWKLAPNLLEDFTAGDVASLFEYLKNECNLQLVRAHDTLEPIILSKSESLLLQTGEGVPALRIESLTLGLDDQPVEMTNSIIRGDRSKYIVEYVR
jgi:GntR family transcriptional regulator